MNIKIKAVDIELTEAIENYADKKVKEALEKFIKEKQDTSILIEVELSKTNNHHSSGDMYKASARAQGFQKNIFAEEIKDDLYAAIDGLKDKLSELVLNTKTKRRSISHKLAIKFKNLLKKGK